MHLPQPSHDALQQPPASRDSSSFPAMSNSGINGLPNTNGLQMALQIAGALMQGAQGASSQTSSQQPAANDLLSLLALQGASASVNNAGGAVSGSYSQNALNIGPPVGAYPNDEELVVQALYDSEERGWTYRRALETLHGVNDHLASQWKDYYLDNAQRLNRRVDFLRSQERRDKPLVTAKKPAFDSPPRSLESSTSARRSAQTALKQQNVSRKSSDSVAAGPSSAKGKQKEGNGLPRSPSPPVFNPNVQEIGGGKYRFTDEENKYMVKYARYRLSLDPDVSKTAICKSIAKKLPHHSFNSWHSHWHSIREEIERKLPQLRAPQDVGAVDDGELYTDVDDSESPMSDADSEADIKNMGGAGGSVTNADKRVIARYAASFGREWATMRGNERWDPFEAMYPQRKSKSWLEVYRRYERELEPMIKKYRKRRLAEVKTQQTGRPSWAPKRSDSPRGKRSRAGDYYEDDDDGGGDYPLSKRAR